MHVTDYGPCQDFAERARAAGAQTIVYGSVRDPEHRPAYAVLTPAVFASAKPGRLQSWHIRIAAEGGLASCEAPRRGLAFPLEVFRSDPRLATLG